VVDYSDMKQGTMFNKKTVDGAGWVAGNLFYVVSDEFTKAGSVQAKVAAA